MRELFTETVPVFRNWSTRWSFDIKGDTRSQSRNPRNSIDRQILCSPPSYVQRKKEIRRWQICQWLLHRGVSRVFVTGSRSVLASRFVARCESGEYFYRNKRPCLARIDSIKLALVANWSAYKRSVKRSQVPESLKHPDCAMVMNRLVINDRQQTHDAMNGALSTRSVDRPFFALCYFIDQLLQIPLWNVDRFHISRQVQWSKYVHESIRILIKELSRIKYFEISLTRLYRSKYFA